MEENGAKGPNSPFLFEPFSNVNKCFHPFLKCFQTFSNLDHLDFESQAVFKRDHFTVKAVGLGLGLAITFFLSQYQHIVDSSAERLNLS